MGSNEAKLALNLVGRPTAYSALRDDIRELLDMIDFQSKTATGRQAWANDVLAVVV